MVVTITPNGDGFHATAPNGIVVATDIDRDRLERFCDVLYRPKFAPSQDNVNN